MKELNYGTELAKAYSVQAIKYTAKYSTSDV